MQSNDTLPTPEFSPTYRPTGRDLLIQDIAARLLPESNDVPVITPQRNFSAYGGAAEFWRTRDSEVILSGPAETGKTISTLHYLDSLAWQYPGFQGAIVRQTYKSMVGTVLQTFEKKVINAADGIEIHGGSKPEWYDYPNGSRIWVGGMDNPDKVLSSERDAIYVNQAEELSLESWETLTTRTTGRAGNMPFGQTFGDCNPGSFNHWIKTRSSEGKLRLLESRHEDNPTLYNPTTGEITEQGRRSLAALDKLTGVRYFRLRKGLWVAAEGMVYDTFDRAHHVDKASAGPFKRYIAGVDWGFKNPGCIGVWGLDGDLRMTEVREVYFSHKTIDWWITEALKVKKEFNIEIFVCDPSQPGSIQQFKNAGIKAVGAFNDIELGVDNCKQRLAIQDDGLARLFFMRDALAERDEDLAANHRPTSSLEEIEAYVYPKGADGKPLKEIPVDDNNHGMDQMRYAAAYVDKLGGTKIQLVKPVAVKQVSTWAIS